MNVGDTVAVGPLSVLRTDSGWIVQTPDGEFTSVTESPDGFGFAGVGWAVDAVATAEQAADEPEWAGPAVSPS